MAIEGISDAGVSYSVPVETESSQYLPPPPPPEVVVVPEALQDGFQATGDGAVSLGTEPAATVDPSSFSGPAMRVGAGGVLVPISAAGDESTVDAGTMSGSIQLGGQGYTVIKGEVYSGGAVVGTIDDEFHYDVTVKGEHLTGTLENLTPEILAATNRRYSGEDAANLTPARVELRDGRLSPEEVKARYSDWGKGRLPDLESLVKEGKLQEAYTSATKWGFYPEQIAEYFNQKNGTNLRGDDVRASYQPKAFSDLEAQGYTCGRYPMNVPFKLQAFIDEVAPDKLPAMDQALNTPLTIEDYVKSKNPTWAAKAREQVAKNEAIRAEEARLGVSFVVGPSRPPTAAVAPAKATTGAAPATPSAAARPSALERTVDAVVAQKAPQADAETRVRLREVLLSLAKQTNQRSPEAVERLMQSKDALKVLNAAKAAPAPAPAQFTIGGARPAKPVSPNLPDVSREVIPLSLDEFTAKYGIEYGTDGWVKTDGQPLTLREEAIAVRRAALLEGRHSAFVDVANRNAKDAGTVLTSQNLDVFYGPANAPKDQWGFTAMRPAWNGQGTPPDGLAAKIGTEKSHVPPPTWNGPLPYGPGSRSKWVISGGSADEPPFIRPSRSVWSALQATGMGGTKSDLEDFLAREAARYETVGNHNDFVGFFARNFALYEAYKKGDAEAFKAALKK